MENNSIKSNLTKEDIISDIKLCLSADLMKEYLYVIVEGEDDTNFLKSRFCNRVFLYESYDGKNGVNEIVNNFFQAKKQVIGIRDKDYEMTVSSNKIFYYDYCCMELMFVNCNETFESVYHEFYKGPLELCNLREYIVNELKYISTIRMFNEQKQWGILLKALSINTVFDKVHKKIDNDKVIQKLKEVNPGFFNEEILDMISEQSKKQCTTMELFNITQGHDFSTFFAIICNMFKKKGISHKNIECSLRCAFRNSDFIKTNLYLELKNYESLLKNTYLCA